MALSLASQARAQSLMQSQEAARRNVMESLQTQYQAFLSAKDKERSLVSAIEGAQIVVDSYGRQFIAGRKTWLEVLNAVRELSDYQRQLLEVQAQMVASFYKLQVDFGAMSWQRGHQSITEPTTEFRPYREFNNWVDIQKNKIKKRRKPAEPMSSEALPEWTIDETAFVGDPTEDDSEIEEGEGIAMTEESGTTDKSEEQAVKDSQDKSITQ